MVAIAIGIIAATAYNVGFGSVNTGRAKIPVLLSAGKALNKSIPDASLMI